MKTALFSLALIGVLSASAPAAFVFRITEAYTSVSGADGTVDWFELTNLGDTPGSTGGLYYDDDSMNPTNNFALPDFSVAPGESIIVLIEAGAGDVPVFNDFWGLSGVDVQVGTTGGGSLGQGGDTIYVFDSNMAGANVVDSLSYTGAIAGLTGTIEDITGEGPLTNSQLGINGAFQSAGVSGIGQLVGSPGLIPEPASALLFGLASLMWIRRR